MTATNNQSERVKEEPNNSSNKRSFNILDLSVNSSTNQNSETDQSPAKISKMQEIGKMLLIRPSSNQNRQNRVINQKTNSPPNTEVSSSSDRPEVISGKELFLIQNTFFDRLFYDSSFFGNHYFQVIGKYSDCGGNGSQLKNPDISGALSTLRIQYSYTQIQCEDGARDVRVL